MVTSAKGNAVTVFKDKESYFIPQTLFIPPNDLFFHFREVIMSEISILPPLASPPLGNYGTIAPLPAAPNNGINKVNAASVNDDNGDGQERRTGPDKSKAYSLFTDHYLVGDGGLDFIGIMMAILVGKLNAYGSTISTLKMSLDKKFAATDALNELVQELTMADIAIKSDAPEKLPEDTVNKLKKLLGVADPIVKSDKPDVFGPGEIVKVTNGGNTELWTSKANVTSWLNFASSTVTKLQNLGNIDTAGMQTASQSMNTVTDLVSNGLKRVGDAANTPVTNMR